MMNNKLISVSRKRQVSRCCSHTTTSERKRGIRAKTNSTTGDALCHNVTREKWLTHRDSTIQRLKRRYYAYIENKNLC